jgi:hypothetical protein
VNTMTQHTLRARTSLVALVAAGSAALTLALAGGHAAHGHSSHAEPAVRASSQLALHDGMRKLWEDHITWTRLFIVSAAADLPDKSATTTRLLRNQQDIGNALKPYYGRRAGNRVTALLEEHILVAAELLDAAKAGDQSKVADAKARWYANGNAIADFLNRANPRNWKRGEMRSMMRRHLDLTLTEAVAHLQGDFTTDVATYDRIHRQILGMADMLSDGIVKQFPRRFR